MQAYDELVLSHYDRVAEQEGLSGASTMQDEVVRAKETETILALVAEIARVRRAQERPAPLVVLDVGCGNGYTLRRLAQGAPEHRYIGVEYNEKLRTLAQAQLDGLPMARVIAGDLRKPLSIAAEPGDVVICQRVLINLMDAEDQRRALDTVVGLARPEGVFLFIEAFASGLANLNAARAEFGLDPIMPAVHNLYLPDDFFDHTSLCAWQADAFNVTENLLSTHYFVSRVLHPAALKAMADEQGFRRNSHFVRFLSAALPDAVGNYAPLRIKTLQRA